MISRHLKNSAIIFNSLLFVALVSCGKKSDAVSIARPALLKEPVRMENRIPLSVEKPRDTTMANEVNGIYFEKVPSPVPEKTLKTENKAASGRAAGDRKVVEQSHPSKPEKELVSRVRRTKGIGRQTGTTQSPSAPLDDGLARCFSLSGTARTTEDARYCAKAHMNRALDLMSSNMDSAYIYCQKAISLYENGSLFTLKAEIFYALGRYSEACQAAECSIARHDHWDVVDRVTAGKVRYDAYCALFKKYPSRTAQENVEKADIDFKMLRSEAL